MEKTKSTGDQYREMARQLPNLAKAIELLKQLVPGNDEALDQMMATYQARVEQAKSSVKRKKLVKKTSLVSDILGGDHLGEKSKTVGLLNALNKQGWRPKFEDASDVDEFRGSDLDDIISTLSDSFDIEVSVDDLVYFSFHRSPPSRSQLAGVHGAILPDGQIYVEDISDDRSSSGPYLLRNVTAFKNLTAEWLGQEEDEE
jgi:hypothetical protein